MRIFVVFVPLTCVDNAPLMGGMGPEQGACGRQEWAQRGGDSVLLGTEEAGALMPTQ